MILKLYVICTVKMKILQTKTPQNTFLFFTEGLVLEAKASAVIHPSWVFMAWLCLYTLLLLFHFIVKVVLE